IFQMKNRIAVLTAVVAGILAVVLALVIPGNAYIVLASMLAAWIGVMIKRAGR
ncbi:MAG: branched-chain amino acid ABC transporter permease, partial [Deltaproteobacteria bacterium]|nr:branched-chain amino acid ABC transporter permease [Deltaproteobacteria bacterium]